MGKTATEFVKENGQVGQLPRARGLGVMTLP